MKPYFETPDIQLYLGDSSQVLKLKAARLLGRKSIGIEINKDYCDICLKRLSQQVLVKE